MYSVGVHRVATVRVPPQCWGWRSPGEQDRHALGSCQVRRADLQHELASRPTHPFPILSVSLSPTCATCFPPLSPHSLLSSGVPPSPAAPSSSFCSPTLPRLRGSAKSLPCLFQEAFADHEQAPCVLPRQPLEHSHNLPVWRSLP